MKDAIYHLKNYYALCQKEVTVGCRVYGHRVEDDKDVVTSVIEKIDGNVIVTWSGSTYILEEPYVDV